jgi:hypothetical protein
VLLEGLELNILFMTEEAVRVVAWTDLSGRDSTSSFLGLPFTPQLSLRVLSCPPNMLKLEVELFRRFESK